MKVFNQALYELVQELNQNEDIFICGPSYGSHKLRVYAYGGLLCQIPTPDYPNEEIILPDLQYVKYVKNADAQQRLIQAFDLRLEKVKRPGQSKYLDKYVYQKTAPKGNSTKCQLLKDNLPELLQAMRDRSERGKNGENQVTERMNQNRICRAHRDFHTHNGVVVCDFESAIPRKLYQEGMKRLGLPEPVKSFPACDLLTFSCSGGKFCLSLIELKCNRSACQDKPRKKGSSSGLGAHARDMNGYRVLKEIYGKEILRRFHVMLSCGYGLLDHIPEGLCAEVEQAINSPERVTIQAGFLFTGDGKKQIFSASHARKLCEEADYLKEHLHEFCYQYQKDPGAVDLSRMKGWESWS